MSAIKAFAKINLVLEVLGRRDDGYHDVSTVVHSVDLADRLSVEAGTGLFLECATPAIANEDNLVMRAARLLQEAAGCSQGARIRLEKGIPMAAGLGGGSSNAAAALLALNELWGLGWSEVSLVELGARLGSDVPFFLQRAGCALATGRGELVTPLPPVKGWWAVVLWPKVPPLPNKTAMLYSMLAEADYTDGSMAAALAEELNAGKLAPERLYNAFDRVADGAFPGLEGYRRVFQEAGAGFANLVGSGPALYTLVDSAEQGKQLLDALGGDGHEVYLAELRETPLANDIPSRE